MNKVKQITNYIKRNKEGLILGAIVGYFVSFAYTQLGGADLTFVFQSQGLFDNLLATIQTPHIAYIKLSIFSMIVGAVIGMIVDEKVRWL